jgi:NitT/TauT family transport system substrate-binding protein
VIRHTAAWLIGAMALLAAGTAQAADHLRVARPSATGFGLAQLNVGIAAGIFAKHDLDIEDIVLDGAAKQHQAQMAHAIDISLGAGTDFAFLIKGSPEKAVAAVAGPPLNFVTIVRSDGKINTVADLKGKRIAATTVGAITYWFADQIAVREGWTSNDALTVVALGNFDAQRAALVTGEVNAIAGTLEQALILQQANSGKLLLRFGDFINPFLTHMMLANDDLIARNPDALRRYLAAWFETVQWMRDHRDEGIRYDIAATKLPLDIANKAYDEELSMFFTDGHFDPKAVAIVENALVSTGQLDKLPDNSNYIHEAFLP